MFCNIFLKALLNLNIFLFYYYLKELKEGAFLQILNRMMIQNVNLLQNINDTHYEQVLLPIKLQPFLPLRDLKWEK